MINDLKLGFKIMKYGHSAKLSIIGGIVMTVIGIGISATNLTGSFNLPGGYFLTLAALLLLQLISTVNAANLVQASPAKKKLQTSVPALISIMMMSAAYLLDVIVFAVILRIHPEAENYCCSQILYSVCFMGVVMLYYGTVYKYFVASTIMFALLFLGVYSSYSFMTGFYFVISGGSVNLFQFTGFWGNFWLTAVIGLAVILVCGVLQYLLSLAVYKAPISKLALGARLRNQM
ncbi:MAG: hypothetical protein NC123_18000 [Butyrivibrio sp.]|nr:hypothetical protein [Acetatifactor muris]MCM1561406.1 hypothetical protein [Butyrivibrio sp.]